MNMNYNFQNGGGGVAQRQNPFSDVQSFPNQSGNPQQQQQPGRRQANYQARPFSDLIDEDKRPFVRRRICQTLCGGYRTVMNEAEENSIPFYLHLAQMIVYLIVPGVVILMYFVSKTSKTAGIILGGAIPAVLNLIFQTISFALEKSIQNKSKGKNSAAVDLSEPTCCGASTYLFVFPARSNIIELITVILLTGVYGSLMTYFMNCARMNDIVIIPTVIVMFFSSYSLFSKPIPESTPYLTSDSFSIFSHHYQRIYYSIVFAIIAIICETHHKQKVCGYLQIINIIVLVLQMLGILSNFFVTLMWLLEQIEIFVFGSTARASDLRIVLSFTLNLGFIIICSYLSFKQLLLRPLLLIVPLAFISSHNIFYTLGLIKPFKVINYQVQQQQEYANIVFGSSKAASHQQQQIQIVKKNSESSNNVCREILKSLLHSIIIGVLSIGLVFLEEFKVIKLNQNTSNVINALMLIPFIISIIIYIITSIFRRAICRVVKCCNKKNDFIHIIISGLKALIILSLTFAYTQIYMQEVLTKNNALIRITKQLTYHPTNPKFFIGIQVVFAYRAFNRLFHQPIASSLESFEVFIFMMVMKGDPSLAYLFVFQFINSRVFIFYKKLDYVLVSLITAQKNKKQRFKIQMLCFILQFTLLIPFFILVLIVTTLLDTATIPYLGFAYFIIGYPKPKRGWSDINPVSANPNDERSDGLLYQAMMNQFHQQIKLLSSSDVFNFRVGEYYLFKNEKMIILMQILEQGQNYMIYTIKGTELQETTVCHAEENENVNQMSESIFKKGNLGFHYAISLSALKEINFAIYDDSKASLTGIIDNPEFGIFIKKAFLQIVLYKFQEQFKNNQQIKYYKILKSELNQKEIENVQKLINPTFSNHINSSMCNLKLTYENIPKGFDTNRQNMQINKVAHSDNTTAFVNGTTGQKSLLEMLDQKQSQLQPAAAAKPFQQGSIPAIANDKKSQDYLKQKQQQEEVKVGGPTGRGGGLADLDNLIETNKQNKNQQLPPLDKSKNNKEGSHLNELDELDDLLNGMGGGIKGNNAKQQNNTQNKQPNALNKNANKINDPWGDLENDQKNNQKAMAGTNADDIDELWGNINQNIKPQQQQQQKQTVNTSQKQVEKEIQQKKSLTSNVLQPSTNQQSPLATQPSSAQSSAQFSDLTKLVYESFYLLFRDQISGMPQTIFNLFKGEFKKDVDNNDFVTSQDKNILHMKYVILQSLRVAFHYCVESFLVMGEMEMPMSHTEFINEINQIESDWFFAGEGYLWNQGIEKNLPNLERLIMKKGSYFAHRLKYGKSEESTFYIYQFRSEVVRGIWANLNMELLYYTNANDERFSIQAEKDILRNLLVQMAEIPLGYPVYSSGARTVYY